MTSGVLILPQADLFTTIAEPLGVKRSTSVTFAEYVEANRRRLSDILNCFRYANMATTKAEINLPVVFFASDKRSSPCVKLQNTFY
jgi:hypothetical protein